MNEDQNQQQNQQGDSFKTIKEIKSAQTFITVATIAAPVSLLFGGVLLSSIALICGIVGQRKLKSIHPKTAQEKAAIQVALKSVRMALIMCAIALVLNAVSMYFMYPTYLEILESGDTSALQGGSAQPSSNSQPSSVWG